MEEIGIGSPIRDEGVYIVRIGDVVRVKLSPEREVLKPYAGERAHVTNVEHHGGTLGPVAIYLNLIDRPGYISCYSDEVDVLEARMR